MSTTVVYGNIGGAMGNVVYFGGAGIGPLPLEHVAAQTCAADDSCCCVTCASMPPEINVVISSLAGNGCCNGSGVGGASSSAVNYDTAFEGTVPPGYPTNGVDAVNGAYTLTYNTVSGYWEQTDYTPFEFSGNSYDETGCGGSAQYYYTTLSVLVTCDTGTNIMTILMFQQDGHGGIFTGTCSVEEPGTPIVPTWAPQFDGDVQTLTTPNLSIAWTSG